MVKFTVVSILAAWVAGVVASQDVLTEMYLVGFPSQAYVASVIKSDATATTFSITCAETASCALPTDFKFTQGPSTLHYDYSHKPTAADDPSGIIDLGCDITSSISGECSKTVSAKLGTITSTAVSASTTFTNAASDLAGHIVTITAGKLVVPTTASSTTSSVSSKTSSKSSAQVKSSTSTTSTTSTTSSTSQSDTSSVVIVSTATVEPQPATTAAPSMSTTSTSAADSSFFQASATVPITTSSSAGAMPMITAPAQWLIGGAAAALALAAM